MMFLTGAEPHEIWPLIRDHHYSKRMPGNIQHVYVARSSGGLFGDNGEPEAAAVFSIPGTRWSEDLIELTRLVRKPSFDFYLSHLISFSVARLRLAGHNLCVSFADRTQRHHGGIYQAAGWAYAGCRERRMDGILLDGMFIPGRSANSRWGTRSPSKLRDLLPSHSIEPHWDEGKHLYWKAIHRSGEKKAARLGLTSVPYPKEFAACPMDERVPTRASYVQPVEAAP